MCFDLPEINKYYVGLSLSDKNIEYLGTIVHEIGHAIDLSLYDRQTFTTFNNSYMQEVGSIFYELLFFDYLKNNGISRDEVDNYFLTKLNSYYDRMYSLRETYDYDVHEFLATGDVFSLEHPNLLMPFIGPLKYSLGSYYAFYLRHLYNYDRKHFNKVFEEFMKSKNKLSALDGIKILGVSPDAFSSLSMIEDDLTKPFYRLCRKYKMCTYF